MSKPPNLPVYIVYDDTVVEKSDLREKVENLSVSVQRQLDGRAVLRLTVIRPGELTECPEGSSSCRLDLAGAFKRIAIDLNQQHCLNPEVLVLLGTWPLEDWVDGWRRLEPIFSYWFLQSAAGGPGRAEIEAQLRKVSSAEGGKSRHEVVQTNGGQDVTSVFQKLQERIVQRKEGLRPSAPPPRTDPASSSVAPSSDPEEDSGVLWGASEESSASQTSPSSPGLPERGAGEISEPAAPSRVPAKWVEKEPPPEVEDRYPHVYKSAGATERGWYMVGASQRGRLHAHEGTYREDAFLTDHDAGWHMVAVADGAGSHKLSRVGSNLAVSLAIQAMKQAFSSEQPTQSVATVALQKALKAAWNGLFEEAKKRGIDFKDLGTTLLLLAHHPDKNLVSVAQIGDGLLAAMAEDRTIHLLGKPESGEYSGQTLFLTNHKPEELLSKVDTQELPGLILLLTMTDGVADDLYPPQEKLGSLIKALPAVVASEDPEEALLKMINYERQGSFDDRTLVVLSQKEKLSSLQKPAETSSSKETEDGRDAV